MLWYGFIYYIFFFFVFFFFIVFFSRLFYLNFVNKLLIYNYLIKISLGFFIFFSFLSLTVLYYIYDYFSNFFYFNNFDYKLVIYDNLTFNFYCWYEWIWIFLRDFTYKFNLQSYFWLRTSFYWINYWWIMGFYLIYMQYKFLV